MSMPSEKTVGDFVRRFAPVPWDAEAERELQAAIAFLGLSSDVDKAHQARSVARQVRFDWLVHVPTRHEMARAPDYYGGIEACRVSRRTAAGVYRIDRARGIRDPRLADWDFGSPVAALSFLTKDPQGWIALFRGKLGPSERQRVLGEAVRAFCLPGHAEEVDEKLLARQLDEVCRLWELDGAILDLTYDCAEVALLNWDLFVGEGVPLSVRSNDLDYAGEVVWPELRAALSAREPGVPLEDWENIRTVPAPERHRLLSADTRIAHALEVILRERGMMRGPCSGCGRKSWAVKYRPKTGRGGRPRLSGTLCPACELAHKRQVKALDQQAFRRRHSSGKPPGRPKKTP